MALLKAVPIEAREWYLSQLLGAKPEGSWRMFISAASIVERLEIINFTTNSLLEDSKNTESSELIPRAV